MTEFRVTERSSDGRSIMMERVGKLVARPVSCRLIILDKADKSDPLNQFSLLVFKADNGLQQMCVHAEYDPLKEPSQTLDALKRVHDEGSRIVTELNLQLAALK